MDEAGSTFEVLKKSIWDMTDYLDKYALHANLTDFEKGRFLSPEEVSALDPESARNSAHYFLKAYHEAMIIKRLAPIYKRVVSEELIESVDAAESLATKIVPEGEALIKGLLECLFKD
ncbi:hypothetical protein GOV06_00630 [Candidatus Woesearchaeota archaeon]|nr:hypothetical protein [Candidatus Woesearchaeota archaeon]